MKDNETPILVYQRGPYTLSGVLAGAIVGCTELCFSYPLELAKTQLQLDREGKPGKYIGMTDVIRKMIKKKGFLSLYRGFGVVMFFTLPQESVKFGVYEELKSMFINEHGHLTPHQTFLCGLGAGVMEAIVAVTPMETMKVKLIHDQRAENPIYKGFFLKAVIKIIKKEGIRGIYQGLFATVLKQATNQGIRFTIFETFKNGYCDWNKTKKAPTPVLGIFGMLAGITSVLLNNPIDVVKTRMQGLYGKDYKNMFDCFKRIYSEEGYFAFYKGTKARCCRVAVDVGFTFMCYDLVKNLVTAFFDR